nr:hypothetical protein [Erythrobacter colymbi]
MLRAQFSEHRAPSPRNPARDQIGTPREITSESATTAPQRFDCFSIRTRLLDEQGVPGNAVITLVFEVGRLVDYLPFHGRERGLVENFPPEAVGRKQRWGIRHDTLEIGDHAKAASGCLEVFAGCLG